MQISQLSRVLQFPSAKGQTIILYASIPSLPIPSDLGYRAFQVQCVDDIKMVFTLHPPSVYVLPPATSLEWKTLPLCDQGYRVYDHPTTARVAVECLRHKAYACGGIIRSYNSLWRAVEELGR